jgi:hypothetical protein
MFILLFLILLALWAGGFLFFHVTAGLIHVLLLFALISLLGPSLSGKSSYLAAQRR